MVDLFANSGDLHQIPCAVASDLGLHCWPCILNIEYCMFCKPENIIVLLWVCSVLIF